MATQLYGRALEHSMTLSSPITQSAYCYIQPPPVLTPTSVKRFDSHAQKHYVFYPESGISVWLNPTDIIKLVMVFMGDSSTIQFAWLFHLLARKRLILSKNQQETLMTTLKSQMVASQAEQFGSQLFERIGQSRLVPWPDPLHKHSTTFITTVGKVAKYRQVLTATLCVDKFLVGPFGSRRFAKSIRLALKYFVQAVGDDSDKLQEEAHSVSKHCFK